MLAALTGRERQVALLVGAGHSDRQIATRLVAPEIEE
ncbi:DNA-binding CsgD family transcriptional regulator [Catenulispora sp. GAS73]